MNFNINNTVKVKLTDYGRRMLEADHYDFWNKQGRLMPYKPPEEDYEGWSEWQLWVLMRNLGPHITLGSDIPFETTIQIEPFENKP